MRVIFSLIKSMVWPCSSLHFNLCTSQRSCLYLKVGECQTTGERGPGPVPPSKEEFLQFGVDHGGDRETLARGLNACRERTIKDITYKVCGFMTSVFCPLEHRFIISAYYVVHVTCQYCVCDKIGMQGAETSAEQQRRDPEPPALHIEMALVCNACLIGL